MSADVPVAIVGIGCKFPGGADTKEQYYEFLRGKVSVVATDHCKRHNSSYYFVG